MYEKIPNELKVNARFCLWKYEQRNGKKTKVPYQLNGCRAKSNVPACFGSFADACSIADDYDGIGMGVFEGYSAIDIDHCVENGKLTDLAQDIIDTMNSYTEISPSGTGVRIIFKVGNMPFDKAKYYINNRNIGLEVYVSGATSKFVTITGCAINNTDVNNCDDELLLVLDKYMKRSEVEHNHHNAGFGSALTDEQVLEKAMNSKNADKFIALWSGIIPEGKSSSEADMSLAMHLSFWCGGDIEQMDRLFRQSGLMRDKWDRIQSGTTYGNITLTKAVNTISAFYVKPCSALENHFNLNNILKEYDAYHNYPATDNGTSRLFADVFKNKLRYVPERKAWYYYDGSRWQEDVGSMYAMEQCKALMLELLRYSIDLQNSDYTKYCNKMQSRHNRLIILNDAQSVYPISMSDFDKDKYLFNCNNGTLDLSTNTFREHCVDDMITKCAPVDYDPLAQSVRFDEFVNEIMSSDGEKAAFLQKALGYAISGDTRYECMFILYGATTRNGKGTLMESTLNVMGDYGRAVKPETIALKQNNSTAPSEDIARLAGVRFANISEPGKGMVINAAQVKSMTGNDTINARFLHENSFDYKPQFKLYVNTNYLPVITDLTLFSSNRLFIIPFDRHFEDWEQDKTLKSEFTAENTKSAILNWLIEGYKKLSIEGLKAPLSVRNATDEYNKDSDKLHLFADECLVENGSTDVRTASVYSVYREWCSNNGMYPESTRVFNQSLRSLGEVRRKRPIGGGEKTTVLIGYSINPEYTFIV